jgi:hypothetical protein
MPGQNWDESGLRFRPPPAVTLFVPVVVAFLIQVPGTIGISIWLHVPPRFALISTALAAASALALLAARRWPGPTVAVIAALTLADLFVPPDVSPPSRSRSSAPWCAAPGCGRSSRWVRHG